MIEQGWCDDYNDHHLVPALPRHNPLSVTVNGLYEWDSNGNVPSTHISRLHSHG